MVVGSPEVEQRRTAGEIFRLIRHDVARTRSDLATVTGLGKSSVIQRVDALRSLELLVEDSDAEPTRGRPAARFGINARAGVLLGADLGASHARLAATDLLGDVLVEEADDLAIGRGPEAVLAWVRSRFDHLLAEAGRTPSEVWGIGIGLPGPVEFATGRPMHPPIMPGWHDVAVPGYFAESYPDVPVLVDNDVNVMAIGEHRAHWTDERHLLYVKVGTGIGCGIVAGGRIHRGAQGAAGDIGHIRVSGPSEVVCSCSNLCCLEAHASGTAMARRLTEMGIPASGSRDVLRLVAQAEPAAARVVRDSGRLIGTVLATIVNFFNPSVILVGGAMAQAESLLRAGIREVVYQRSLPLATRDLVVATGQLGERAGVVGAVTMISEQVLSATAIDRRIAHGPAAHQATQRGTA